jgi:hypothetical protein
MRPRSCFQRMSDWIQQRNIPSLLHLASPVCSLAPNFDAPEVGTHVMWGKLPKVVIDLILPHWDDCDATLIRPRLATETLTLFSSPSFHLHPQHPPLSNSLDTYINHEGCYPPRSPSRSELGRCWRSQVSSNDEALATQSSNSTSRSSLHPSVSR